MNKRYRVTLTPDERLDLEQLLAKGKAAARKLTRARILPKPAASPAGPARDDHHQPPPPAARAPRHACPWRRRPAPGVRAGPPPKSASPWMSAWPPSPASAKASSSRD